MQNNNRLLAYDIFSREAGYDLQYQNYTNVIFRDILTNMRVVVDLENGMVIGQRYGYANAVIPLTVDAPVVLAHWDWKREPEKAHSQPVQVTMF